MSEGKKMYKFINASLMRPKCANRTLPTYEPVLGAGDLCGLQETGYIGAVSRFTRNPLN